MTTDVTAALATLQLHPEDSQALKALAALHPGNGAGIDAEVLSKALSDARRFHRERGDFDLVVSLIDLELAWTTGAGRRADLLHEKGRVLFDELLRDEAGQACVREALDAAPGHTAATESLAQMSLVRANWEPISKRYLQQAEGAKDPALASSLYGSVAEFHLKYRPGDGEGETYLRKSLELDPHNRRSGNHFERVLREKGNNEELLTLYVGRADRAANRDERALAEVSAAEQCEKMNRAVDAYTHYRKALEANPVEPRALRAVRAVLEQQQEWAELGKVLEGAARSKRGEQDVALLIDLATLIWKRLNQPDMAEAVFRRVRKLDPSNHAMVEFYREYYTAKNEPTQLLTILAQAQKTEGDVERRVAMGIEMARAAEKRTQHADKAIEIWKGILRLKPHLPEAVTSLRALYTKTEKWNALLELLKDNLDAVPAANVDEKINRYLEIVAIYRDRLNLDVMVVNTYLNILALKPDHPAALAALASRYEAQGRYGDLVQVLTRQADAAKDSAERVALHRRIAALWADKLGKHGNAIASFEKIFEADPTDTETSARLKDLYAKGRAWRPLIEVYRRELPHVDTAERRARLLEMARIAGDRLNDVRESISVYNQVLALQERDPDALAGLATLYDRERRWPALIEILERQRLNAHAANDAAGELALLERRGTLLHDRLGATQAAIDVFKRIQELQPKNARAARALREIYAQAGDYSALESLYADHGAFGDLCDQLTSLADRTADMAARTRLLERVALIAQEKLNQPERALKAYERILATDPKNRAAALALLPLYRNAQKWPRLLATYEVLLGPAAAGEGIADKLELYAEARKICETRLGSKALAFQWCARAFEAAPKNDAVRGDLERLAGEADEWSALAALYATRTAATTDAEERMWLLRRTLRIADSRLNRPQDVRRVAEQIIAELGFDEEADASLEKILTQTKAWTDLAKLLHARADRAPDAAERVRLLFRIAQLEEERVVDAAAASLTWKKILEAEPTNERALRALIRLSEARQDWAGVVEGLRRDLASRPADNRDERETLLLRIANIQEVRLDDPDATFATYREVLQANQFAPPAVAGLERLLAGGYADRPAIARLTLPFYERTGDAPKLAAANEVLLAIADTRGEKVERLEKLRALYSGPANDPAGAYRVSMALFDIDPADAKNRDALIGFADLASKTGELAEKLRAVSAETTDQILRRDLLVLVAELAEKRLGRAQDAEKVYAQILKAEPLHAGAFRALTRLYRDTQRWGELRTLLDTRQLAELDVRERLDLLAQIAELDESALGDQDHALAVYEKMLELDAADLRAHRALDRHYAARERWRDLENLLGTRVGFASETEVAELEFRRAELRASHLADYGGALDLLEQIVKTAPNHEGARRLLEKLVAIPEHRQRVAKILEPVYEASSAWARLAAILDVEREVLDGPASAALLVRIADIQENKLQAKAAALATWRQVLAADPSNPDALGEIERLGTVLERFSELVDVYQDLAFKRDAGDIAGRADLLSRAAKLYAGRLGNRRAAIDVWKLVLALDPNDTDTTAPAAAALETLYTETNDVPGLVKILAMQVRWASSGAARKKILFRISDLQEKALGDNDAAVTTLRSILEIDPQEREAIDTLDRIFEAGAQHRQRVEMMRKRIDLAGDAAARQALWRQVAGLLERDVGDVDEAIAACVSILDESPQDDQALETLSRLYEQQGRHRQRLEILERRLALKTGAEHVALLRQIAGLLEGPLGDPAEALERWREVLEAAPADREALAALERFLAPGTDGGLRLAAAQALEPLYEANGRYAELSAVVRVYVEAQTDARGRLEQLMRLASLEESRLGNKEAARVTTALAIRDALAEPELASLLDTFERLTGLERVDDVAALYREISPDVLDEGVKLRLDRTIAEVALAEGDATTAADYHRRVLDRVPDDTDALEALEGIYRKSADAEALYEILVRRAELAGSDVKAERELRLQIGALAESPLERLEEAIAAFERVLELSPNELNAAHARDAAQALDRLYTKAERWGDLTRLLEDLLRRGVLPERDLVGIRFRMAQIEHDRQNDREAALEHLRLVLAGDPDHPGAITMLEGMLKDIAVQGQAAELLEPVYAGRADWKSLILIGEIRLVQTEEPAQRLSWTKRIARLYEEQLEDYDSALRWYGKVFQEAPTERLSLEQLIRLADKLDRWADLASLLSNYLEGELGEEPAVIDIVRRTAEIFDHRLGQRPEAEKYYRRLFDARPDDREVAQLFEAALERWGAWQELRELIDEEAGRAVEPAAKLALLRRSAKLDEEKLDSRGRAIGTLREAMDVDPADRGVAAELERLLAVEGQWHELADHLAATLDRISDAREADAVRLRLAKIQYEKLDDVVGSVDRYAEVLERTPGQPAAVAALEALATSDAERHRIAVILEPVYRRSGDLGKLVATLGAQLESVDDRTDRVRILREMAEIHQRLGRPERAFESRSKAWLTDVESAETLAEMEALGLAGGMHGELVAALEKGAVEAGDPYLQAQLWAMTARLLEEPLGRAGEAIEAWRSALAARPDDRDAFLALERLLSASARSGELVDVLEKHLEITTDAGERKAIAKRIAVLYDDALKQREQAVRAWETVLEIDPKDGDALESLAQLHAAGGAFRELADVYARKLELSDRPEERRLLFAQSARLHEEKLGEPEQAVDQLRKLLEETPGDAEALVSLDRIFTGEGRHADLIEVLDIRTGFAKTVQERDELAYRAARVTETELSDVEAAISRYQGILAATPAHPAALEALSAIAHGDDYRVPAIAVLEPILRNARAWEQVIELLELRLAVEDAVDRRLALLGEIARIQEMERRDVEGAFTTWARALTEEATEAAPRQALERLAAATGAWKRLAEVYEERMDATFDASLQRSLALRLASLYESELADLGRAAEFLRKALALPGDEAPVLASLELILRRQGENAELAEILAREAEVAGDPGQQADFLAALGEVRLAALEDADGALAAYRDAIDRNPEHPHARAALLALLDRSETREGALDVLEPLAQARGDYNELLMLYERRMELHDDRAERAHWLRKMAEVAADQLGNPDKALDALGRALKEEPMPGAALDDLERIAGAAKMPATGAAKIEAAIADAEPDAARELALRAARLYVDGRNPAAAERLYQLVLEGDAENVDALQALETLYRGVQSPDAGIALAAILEKRAEADLDPQARRTRLMEAARLHERRGAAGIPDAIAALQKLSAEDEGDAEALAELGRLHEASGNVNEMASSLAARARVTEDPRNRAALWARVGELRLGMLNDLDGAAEAYREALEGTPDDPIALSALEAIEERREDWSTLQEVLMRRFGATFGADQIAVLLKLARNAEKKLEDADQAIGFLRQIVDADANNTFAYLELERLLRANARWYDLVEILGKHADSEAQAGRRPAELALRVAIADVWEKELDSPDSAAEALEKVLQVAPTNVGALLTLARLHEGAERWDEAAEALDKAAANASAPAEIAAIQYSNAQILIRKEADPAEVERALLRALDADPTHRPTLAALEKMAREAKDDERLVQLLELALETAQDEDEQRRLLREVAGLYAGPLGSPLAALPHLERLVALDPKEVAGREQLADALIAGGRIDDAARIMTELVAELTRARRGKDAARWHTRLGMLSEARGDYKGAADSFGAAYKLDPSHPATVAALGRLAFRAGDLDNARKYYRSLLLQNFDEKTAGVSKAEVYLMLGRMHVLANEIPKARNMFERGLEVDPANVDLKAALTGLG